jgi:repressor LexA
MITPKYFSSIVAFFEKHHRLPSYQEIMKLTGFKSKNAVYRLIERLIAAELLIRDQAGKIVPGRRFLTVPLLGTVEAGWPSPAEEELVDTIGLEEWLIKNRESTFMLKVSGDSMIDAGIRPGDMLLVERGRTPKNGDVVVAEVDTQWTLKYFEKHGNQVVLMPANKKYNPIIPKDELNIAAVVTAVIRKYHT